MKKLLAFAVFAVFGLPQVSFATPWPPFWGQLSRECGSLEDSGNFAVISNNCFDLTAWSSTDSVRFANSPVTLSVKSIVPSGKEANKWIVRAEIHNRSDKNIVDLSAQIQAHGGELALLSEPGIIKPGKRIMTSSSLIYNSKESPRNGKVLLDFGFAELQDGSTVDLIFNDARPRYSRSNTTRMRTSSTKRGNRVFQ